MSYECQSKYVALTLTAVRPALRLFFGNSWKFGSDGKLLSKKKQAPVRRVTYFQLIIIERSDVIQENIEEFDWFDTSVRNTCTLLALYCTFRGPRSVIYESQLN